MAASAAWLDRFMTDRVPPDPQGVNDLRAEGSRGHMVTDMPRPWLSWELPGGVHEGLVELRSRRRDRGAAPAWEWTAQVPIERLGVGYGGPLLDPGERVEWQVKVRAGGPDQDWGGWSDRATFEAGLLGAAWAAGWATTPYDVTGAPLLRCEVDVPEGVCRARLYACGLGSAVLVVDRVVVGDGRLDPPLTDVRRTVLYSATDVSGLLGPGRHVITASLGRGFFAMTTPNVWGWHEAPWRAAPCLIAQVVLDLEDGSRQVVGSTPGRWSCASGPTLEDSLYEGEVYDERRAVDGWHTQDFDATGWRPVVPTDGPAGRLLARDIEPIRVVEDVPAHEVRIVEGRRVVDFGRTTSGWVRLGATLAAGQRLRLRHGEVLAPDGGVEAVNPHVHTARFQCDEVTGAGGRLDWEPSYSYKGFRYVQVDGLGPFQECDLTMRVAHTDVATTAEFSCDVELFEQYDAAMRRSILSNLHGLPTDTPMYEKNGWTGDAQVASRIMATTLDLRRLLPKWLRDMAEAQHSDGRLPVIVPSPGWGYEDRIMAPEWTTAFPHLVREVYRCYGDERTVARHWEDVSRYLAWELGRLDDGLATTGLGDYLSPGTDGLPPEDRRLTATAYLHRALVETAEIAPVAGRARQARHLIGRAAQLAERLNEVFLDPAEGEYRVATGYRQTANAVPLAFGLVPPDQRAAVARRLVEDVRGRDWHLDTGNLGTQVLLPVLSEHGYAADAFRVAKQTTYPGWGAWMAQGADTMWEFWQTPGRSRNHYFQGTVVQWLHEDMVGLRVGDHGWSTFTVRPHAREGVGRAGLRLSTVRGPVAAGWSTQEGRLTVHVDVPSGARATVELPVCGTDRVIDAPTPRTAEIDGWARYQAGPGAWTYTVGSR